MNVIQTIYDSEINANISWFWDGGFDVQLGDKVNGIKAETSLDNWAEVLTWLTEQVKEHYPQSTAAKRFENF